jgi:hypothetical protein
VRAVEAFHETGFGGRPPGIIALTKTAMVALAITLVPQGVWSALIVTNLRTTPSIPWSVLVMAVLMGIGAPVSPRRIDDLLNQVWSGVSVSQDPIRVHRLRAHRTRTG